MKGGHGVRIALVQMKVEEKNRSLNIRHGLELLADVAGKADVAVLPEVWTTGYSLGALRQEAEEAGSQLLKELSRLAKEGHISIVAGSIPFRRDNKKVYNTTIVFNQQGETVAEYDKTHMFSLYNEEKFFSPGDKRTQFELNGVSCGLSICYDLRFPGLFRAMAVNGAELIFLPAEWPSARGADWRLLVQARALENQMYLCAVNCTGKFHADSFYGHSMLVSPTGAILVEGSEEEEILYCDLDTESVAKARSALSVLKDARWELYQA